MNYKKVAAVPTTTMQDFSSRPTVVHAVVNKSRVCCRELKMIIRLLTHSMPAAQTNLCGCNTFWMQRACVYQSAGGRVTTRGTLDPPRTPPKRQKRPLLVRRSGPQRKLPMRSCAAVQLCRLVALAAIIRTERCAIIRKPPERERQHRYIPPENIA